MYKCIYCGLENLSENARFCSECGPEGPAKDWLLQDVDQLDKVRQYATMLNEIFFDAHTENDIEKLSARIRVKLKISHQKHIQISSKLNQQKKAIGHLANFRFEFNENVTDAYAGHDTFLDFRYTNLSPDELFKITIYWDDPETKDRIDLKVEGKNFVKPSSSLILGGSVVFSRIGMKEISDLQITISDQFGETAKFRVESFRFKVNNHEQHITNNISTHNQISIEGRGVVDASGMGADNITRNLKDENQPRWKQLNFNYLSRINLDALMVDLSLSEECKIESANYRSRELKDHSKLTDRKSITIPEIESNVLKENIIEVRVPDIGDFNDVAVIELLVKEGELIKVDQSLITVECDKAIMEIPSSHEGIVKDFKVRLGDKVNKDSLILLLDTSINTKEDFFKDEKCPKVNIYIPSTGESKLLDRANEVAGLMCAIKSMNEHWHILIAGTRNIPKLAIRDLILKDKNFNNIRSTTSGVLETPRDLAAILCDLHPNSLFELDGLDDFFDSGNIMGDLLNPVLADFQLDVMVGEGASARAIKLDLNRFFSIFYCKDIDKIPINFLSNFDCCITLAD
jgi:biotin carboxyl carrier protein